MLLTDAKVKNAKSEEKIYSMFDSGGLYLQVSPKGTKWWRLRYKIEGKVHVISLGIYPEVSLKAARARRDELRVEIAKGNDPLNNTPSIEKRSFHDVAEEWFLIKCQQWAASTQKKSRLLLEAHLYKHLPEKSFNDLATLDYMKVFRFIEAQGHYETAHRICGMCAEINKFARSCGYTDKNPIEDVSSALRPINRKHRATIIDSKEIGKLLRNIEYYRGKPETRLCLKIMPYVFVRSLELRYARWEEFNFTNGIWTIPAQRMKMRRPHVVPLAKQVIDLFEELQKFSGHLAICFPGKKSNTQPLTDVALLNTLRNMGYSREEMCIHGFRSMASTQLNELGYRPDVIEAQLAHSDSNAIRRAYNHAEYLEERKQMMQDWADYLDKLREDKN